MKTNILYYIKHSQCHYYHASVGTSLSYAYYIIVYEFY